MIEVIKYANESFERQLTSLVDEAYSDAQALLDNLPDSIDVAFTKEGYAPSTGVGGFAKSARQINLSVNHDCRDRSEQWRNLRSTVLHESFHVQQGFTFEQSPFTALQSAAYEGCAVVFEREYGDGSVAYADYSSHSDRQLQGWLKEIEMVGNDYFESTETWHKWAFYHPEHQQGWIIYKVGSWLVDRVLRENQLEIIQLKDKTAEQILDLI